MADSTTTTSPTPVPDPAHTAYLSDLAAGCKSLNDTFGSGLLLANEYAVQGYAAGGADPITAADFAGTLTGATPAQVAAAIAFVQSVQSLAATAPVAGGPTFMQAIQALARRSR